MISVPDMDLPDALDFPPPLQGNHHSDR